MSDPQHPRFFSLSFSVCPPSFLPFFIHHLWTFFLRPLPDLSLSPSLPSDNPLAFFFFFNLFSSGIAPISRGLICILRNNGDYHSGHTWHQTHTHIFSGIKLNASFAFSSGHLSFSNIRFFVGFFFSFFDCKSLIAQH